MERNQNGLHAVIITLWYYVHVFVCAHASKKRCVFVLVVCSRFHLYFIIFHFRTIMNCNLRVIQARAFAQNQHLRYMWVNIIYIFDNHVRHAFSRFIMICYTWQLAVYGYRWVSVEQKMMSLIESGFRKIVAVPLLSQQPHILNETSIICLG